MADNNAFGLPEKKEKVYVKHETGHGTFKGNSDERIVPIKLGNSNKSRLRFKSVKGNMEG